jgi:hypothetical protein
MNWTDRVVKAGTQQVLQPRLFVYGIAGIGKSTFGARLPSPLFVDFDHGVDDVHVDRIPGPKTWTESMDLIRSIAANPGAYKSLVIDTVDPLEEMAQDYVAQEAGKSFSKMNDEFGAGHIAVGSAWKLFLAELDIARQNGMLICLLGHARVRQAMDPTLGSFDQFTSMLGGRSWAATQRWSDLVGFASWDAALLDKKGEQRIVVTGKRILSTVRGSGFEGKNRYSLEPKLPLEWPALLEGIEKHRRTAEAVEGRIALLAASLGGDALEKAQRFIKEAAKDLNTLTAIETALQEKLEARTPAGEEVPAEAAPLDQRQAIRSRITELAARVGGEAPAKAAGYMENAGEDLVVLLQIEEALKQKANGGAHV